MILNYLTFLPANLILNSDDFELFYLPTCHILILNSDDFELFYLPTYHPDTELRWFWTILPSYLSSWYWTQMVLNYFTFLPAILILNSNDFELFYLPTFHILILNSDAFELFHLPTCHPDTELKWFWTILPTCLPSRCWIQMILNYSSVILNSNDFELFYLPTCHPGAELSCALMQPLTWRHSRQRLPQSTSFLVKNGSLGTIK